MRLLVKVSLRNKIIVTDKIVVIYCASFLKLNGIEFIDNPKLQKYLSEENESLLFNNFAQYPTFTLKNLNFEKISIIDQSKYFSEISAYNWKLCLNLLNCLKHKIRCAIKLNSYYLYSDNNFQPIIDILSNLNLVVLDIPFFKSENTKLYEFIIDSLQWIQKSNGTLILCNRWIPEIDEEKAEQIKYALLTDIEKLKDIKDSYDSSIWIEEVSF